MSKKLFLKAVAIAALALTASASADIINLTDVTLFTATGTISAEDYVAHGWGDVNYLEKRVGTNSDFVSWNHQFTFDPPAKQFISADLTLFFVDDNDLSTVKTEHGKLLLENGSWHTIFESVLNGSWEREFGIDVASVEDGNLFVSVKNHMANTGFYLTKSVLNVTYNTVPEPTAISAFVLGGISLLGFAASRKRTKK
jgi:hypothetical protein